MLCLQEEANHLYRFPQAHFVSNYAAETIVCHERQPPIPIQLIRIQPPNEIGWDFAAKQRSDTSRGECAPSAIIERDALSF